MMNAWACNSLVYGFGFWCLRAIDFLTGWPVAEFIVAKGLAVCQYRVRLFHGCVKKENDQRLVNLRLAGM